MEKLQRIISSPPAGEQLIAPFRIALVVLLLALYPVLVFATGQGEEDSADGAVTITIGNWPQQQEEEELELYEQYTARMNELHPEITIETDTWQYDANSFLPKAEAGQLPNLFVTWFTEPRRIISGGYAADLTAAMEEYDYVNAINPDMLDLVESDGRYYGVPISGYVLGLQFNLTVMDEAGMLNNDGTPQKPGTWQELAEMAQEIRERTGKAGFFFPGTNNQGGWLFTNVGWNFGVDFLTETNDGWEATFNTPEAVEAVQFIRDLKWEYGALQENNLVDVNESFRLMGTDQVGMSISTLDWVDIPFERYDADRNNYAYTALPEGPGGNESLVGGSLYMASRESTAEQIDAIFKWFDVVGHTPTLDDDGIQALEESLAAARENGLVVGPTGLPIWTDAQRVEVEQELRDQYRNVDPALFRDYVANGAANPRPEEPVATQELYRVLDGVIQAVLTEEDADIQMLLDQAVEDFQRQHLD